MGLYRDTELVTPLEQTKCYKFDVEVLLYVHRNRRHIRDESPKTTTSTFTQLLSSAVTKCEPGWACTETLSWSHLVNRLNVTKCEPGWVCTGTLSWSHLVNRLNVTKCEPWMGMYRDTELAARCEQTEGAVPCHLHPAKQLCKPQQ